MDSVIRWFQLRSAAAALDADSVFWLRKLLCHSYLEILCNHTILTEKERKKLFSHLGSMLVRYWLDRVVDDWASLPHHKTPIIIRYVEWLRSLVPSSCCCLRWTLCSPCGHLHSSLLHASVTTSISMFIIRWSWDVENSQILQFDQFCCLNISYVHQRCKTLKPNIINLLFIYCRTYGIHQAKFRFVTSEWKRWRHMVQNICLISFLWSRAVTGVQGSLLTPGGQLCKNHDPVATQHHGFLVYTHLLTSTFGFFLRHLWYY